VDRQQVLLAEAVAAAVAAILSSKFKPSSGDDAFVPLRAGMRMMGIASRTSVYKSERLGRIPVRRRLPNGYSGWLMSDIQAFLASLPSAMRGNPINNSDGGSSER
jgi:predicted DNA-binding transcriptional regulator AlpA